MFDTDALAQLLIAGQQELLRLLKNDFGVESFMMSEVDVEFRSNRKFGSLLRPILDKAQKSGFIRILTSADLERVSRPADGSPSVTLGDIRELGQEYNLDVQTGEAYTHAASILLDTPAVSNDFSAIKTLENLKRKLPPTVLRSFDIFAFFYAEKYLTEKNAESIRDALRLQNEWIPASMKNAGFVQGIPNLNCRLSTSLAVSAGGSSWSAPFYLKRRTSDSE